MLKLSFNKSLLRLFNSAVSKKRSPLCLRGLTVLLLAAVNLYILIFYAVNPLDILKFILLFILCTLIPGLFLLDVLGLYKQQTYRWVLAVAAGICLDIIVYILFAALQIKSWLLLPFIITGITYLTRQKPWQDLYLLPDALKYMPNRYFISLTILWASISALIVYIYFIPNPLPGSGQAIFYYVDYPWHLGNIAEIKNHWYPQDPRLAGQPFHYHIFFYIYTALFASISDISIPVLFFRLQTPFFIFLLFLTSYYAGSRWFKNRLAGVLNVFIFFFSGGLLFSHPFNIFLKNFFFSPTFLLASIFCLFLFIEIKSYLSKPAAGRLFIIVLLMLGVSGAKGSFFPVLFAGLLGILLCTLYRRQTVKRVLILFISSGLIFATVFTYIFQGTGSEGINIRPLEIIRYTDLYGVFMHLVKKADSTWLRLACFPLYLLVFFSYRGLAFVQHLYNSLTSSEKVDLSKIFIIGVILASFVPAYLLAYRGSSQYYYLFVGFIGLNLLAAGYIQHLLQSEQARLLQVIVIILLLLSTGDTYLMMQNLNDINIRVAAMNNKPLTPGLYAGLSYIREHTPIDALIGSHRSFQYSPDNPRFFYYSAFAERRILVEGWQYMSPACQQEAWHRNEDMKKLYITRNSHLAKKIIRKYDLDYLLVDKHSRQRIRFETQQLLILKFRNETVEVYQVVK